MPYKTPGELPRSVADHLPPHAQEIYMAAYNSAWEEYDRSGERRGGASREETSARVAWAAVKKHYRKDEGSGKWVQK